MTEFTAVTLIVVRPELQQAAEDAAVAADAEGGAGTFVPGVPLREAGDAGNTVVAYWARWHMLPGQRSAFASAMGGPMNLISAGQNVNLNRDRWMFDAAIAQWTPQEVLDVLGFDRLEPTPEP